MGRGSSPWGRGGDLECVQLKLFSPFFRPLFNRFHDGRLAAVGGVSTPGVAGAVSRAEFAARVATESYRNDVVGGE